MSNLQLFAIGGITAYLLYMNMQKNGIEYNDHIKVDITTDKTQMKKNIPIVADERPKPSKPIAIPIIDSPINNYKYHPIQGWIDWDLMNSYHQPKFKTFQSKNYM